MSLQSRAQALVLKEIASLGGVETAAAGSAWWNGLSRAEKKQYIISHPKSKYAQSAGGQTMMARHGARTSRKINRLKKSLDRRDARNEAIWERHDKLAERMKSLPRSHPSREKIKARMARLRQKSAKHTKIMEKHDALISQHEKALKGIVSGLGKTGQQLQKHHEAGKRVGFKGGKLVFGGAKPAAKPAAAPAKKTVSKPAAKVPAKKPAAKPAPTGMVGKKGSLHEHLNVPHGKKLPQGALMRLAKSDHPLAGRARQALRYRGVKGDLGEKKPAAPAAKPAAKKTAAQRKADRDYLTGKNPDPRPAKRGMHKGRSDKVAKQFETRKSTTRPIGATPASKRMEPKPGGDSMKRVVPKAPAKKPLSSKILQKKPAGRPVANDVADALVDTVKKIGGASKLKRAEW